MATIKQFGSLLLIGFLLINSTNAHLKSPIISIEDAFKQNKIKLDIKSKGEYKGNSAIIASKNISKEPIILHLEFGRRLTCSDTSMQDLLVVKEQLITLMPNESKTNDAFAFCCESNNLPPQKEVHFSIGRMAPAEWIKLAEVINKNNFPIEATQHAVWVLSNNHELASVHAENMEEIKALREVLAEIKGIELPWYNIYYLKDSLNVFSGKHYNLKGTIEYHKRNNGITTIQVRQKNGRIMSALVKNASQGPGKYQYPVNIDIKGWPKGEYDVLVFEDQSQLIHKKSFTL